MKKVNRICSCITCIHVSEEDPITELNLASQHLQDVPSSIFMHERTLEKLHLNMNRILDLPTPLFNCHALQVLNLSDNGIRYIPPAVGYLQNLVFLDLHRNRLDIVPGTLMRCKKLSVLCLSLNPLKQLPDVVTQLVSLTELYLNNTDLFFLPANLGRLTGLKVLEVRDNSLSSLPPSLHRCSQLCRLDLGQNDFAYLPTRVGDLAQLEELWMDLNGMIVLPSFIGNLKKLTYLDASENKYIDVPEEIAQCESLIELNLCHNDIEVLPVRLGQLQKLVTLRLDDNEIKEIPHSVGSLKNLQEFSITQNLLYELPQTIGKLRSLVALSVDNNQIHFLPPEIGHCSSLRILTIQNNFLRMLPIEIGQLHNLTVLSLVNNYLSYLPASVLYLYNLKALWLQGNQTRPLTTLLRGQDLETGDQILTCYLLPQNPGLDEAAGWSSEAVGGRNLPESSSSEGAIKQEYKPTKPKVGGQKIRFSPSMGNLESSGSLLRVPTPYPKKLRELSKLARTYQSINPPPTQERRAMAPHQMEVVRPRAGGSNPEALVRRAIVKKKPITRSLESVRLDMPSTSSVSDFQLKGHAPQKPPPYHVAAAHSKQASIFQRMSEPEHIPSRQERTDIDREALSTIKDELRHHLGRMELRKPQSEESSSLTTGDSQKSEADSAFQEVAQASTAPVAVASGTYVARPGIAVDDAPNYPTFARHKIHNYPVLAANYQTVAQGEVVRRRPVLTVDEAPSHPMLKVTDWLRYKGLERIDENSPEQLYPLEPSNSELQLEERDMDNMFAHLPPPSRVRKSSTLNWMFGAHSNPTVFEIVIQKFENVIGFEIEESESGLIVKNVSSKCPGLADGDKILLVEGVDVKEQTAEEVYLFIRKFFGPITLMISRNQ